MSSETGLRAGKDSGTVEAFTGAAPFLTGTALFLFSAGWTYWQNRRVAVMWDLSYLLDSAWRFSLGQVPYREIPFAHAPLTFLLHALLIRLFGRVYWPHLAYAVIADGLGTWVTWRLLRWILRPLRRSGPALAALLATPLIPLGLFGVYPHPIYDNDAILAVLLALYLLTRALDGDAAPRTPLCLSGGAVSVLPLFIKQNIGVAFLGSVLFVLPLSALQRRTLGQTTRRELWASLGICCALLFALGTLQFVSGIPNYLHWTLGFAAQRRLPGPGALLNIYSDPVLRWSLPLAALAGVLQVWPRTRPPWRKIVLAALLTAPFLWTACFFLRRFDADDRADHLLSIWPYVLVLAIFSAAASLRRDRSFRALLPWILLVTIHGAFLAQQLWGSTYAIWPLLLLLIAGLIVRFPDLAWPVAAVASATLALCGGVYAASLERLDYIHLDGAPHESSFPALRGLRTSGPWLPAFDELLQFANAEIPAGDGILLLPGEDPFFFATGRVPRFPALLFDPATYPYNPARTVQLARDTGISWLIVKRETQLTAPPYQALPAISAALQRDFEPYRRLALYDVYRRKQ